MDILQSTDLEQGWFKLSRSEALRQLGGTRFGWRDIHNRRTPRENAQTMLRLLKSTRTSNVYD